MPQVSCPHCGQAYDIPQEQWPQYQGRTITCTRCQQPFTVTAAGAVAPPPAAAAPATAATPPAQAPAAPYPPQPGHAYQQPYMPAPKKGMSGGMIALIVVGICAVLLIPFICLLSLLVPSLGRAREQANRVKCASNLRQLALACEMYANSSKGQFPDKVDRLLVGPMAQELSGSVFICPSTKDTPSTASDQQLVTDLTSGGHDSYIYAGAGQRDSAGRSTVLFYEPITNHQSQGANFAFADGHVEFIQRARAQQMINKLQQGQNPPGP